MKLAKKYRRVLRSVSAGWVCYELLAALSVALSGCNTTGCTDNRSSIPLAGFYDSATLKEIMVDSLSIGGVGAPNDSLLLDCQRAGAVYLPLRQTADQARFFVAYKQKALDFPEFVDTIKFEYSSIEYFASEECGAMLRYRIKSLSHTTNLIDSVALLPSDSIITNVDAENIKIFFRTSSEVE